MLEDVKNVEQSVTFYNVTGYIEKENRIYFAPLNKQLVANAQAGTTKPLCQWYKDYFDSVVGILSSRYQNVSISRWSPSDRTLSVQGTIDLFRKSGVSSDSKAFNYMIVKRVVTGVTSQDASINYAYYMGYFITDVEQSGTNTVRLTLDIDNFTNAFYLMNTQQYSDSELLNLDIFNSTLVNCNVERQHYNRVKLVDGEVKIDNNEIFLNPLESYDYKYQKKVSKSPILVNGVEHTYTNYLEQNITGQSYDPDYANLVAGREYIVSPKSMVATEWSISFTYSSYGQDNVVHIRKRYKSGASKDEIISAYSPVLSITIQPSNPTVLRVMWYNSYTQDSQLVTIDLNSNDYYVTLQFGNTETLPASETNLLPLFHNTVNYLSFTHTTEYNFTQEELELIKSGEDWDELPVYTRKKIISSSIAFVLIRAKENLGLCHGFGTVENGAYTIDGGFKPNRVNGLSSDNTDAVLYNYIIPTIINNEMFDKYQSIINKTVARLRVRTLLIVKTGENTYTTQWSSYHTNMTRKLRNFKEVGESVNNNNIYNSFTSISGLLGNSVLADYILSASIIRDYNLDDMHITDVSDSPEIEINTNVLGLAYQDIDRQVTFDAKAFNYEVLKNFKLPKGLWFNMIPYERNEVLEPSDATDYASKYGYIAGYDGGMTFSTEVKTIPSGDTNNTNLSPMTCVGGTILMISGYDAKDIKLKLEEESKDVTDNFYEPMLETKPYTFYSTSFIANIENPLSKERYASSYDYSTNGYYVDFKFIYSDNDAQKVGLIVYYDFGGVKQPYFMESLIYTLTSQLPMSTDSYNQYYTYNKAQMKSQYAVNSSAFSFNLATSLLQSPVDALSGYLKSGESGAGAGASLLKSASGLMGLAGSRFSKDKQLEITQLAMLAGAGAKPDTIKQAGSDIYFDIDTGNLGLYLNYYRIDDFSYNSIAKGLERYGYLVNRYDTLHVADRVGWNYVKLISADFNHYGTHLNLTTEQESDIMDIFKEGVTLLHSPEYLYNQSLHNHETLIDIDD